MYMYSKVGARSVNNPIIANEHRKPVRLKKSQKKFSVADIQRSAVLVCSVV